MNEQEKLINEIASKTLTIRNLPEARMRVLTQAHVADERMREASAHYTDSLRSILAKLDLEAWNEVNSDWTPEEIAKAKCPHCQPQG